MKKEYEGKTILWKEKDGKRLSHLKCGVVVRFSPSCKYVEIGDKTYATPAEPISAKIWHNVDDVVVIEEIPD